jgi:hypothetical protein
VFRNKVPDVTSDEFVEPKVVYAARDRGETLSRRRAFNLRHSEALSATTSFPHLLSPFVPSYLALSGANKTLALAAD